MAGHPGQQLAQVGRLQFGHHHDVHQGQHGRGEVAGHQPDPPVRAVPAPDQALRRQADQRGQAGNRELIDRDFLCHRRNMQNIAARELADVNFTGPCGEPLFPRIIF